MQFLFTDMPGWLSLVLVVGPVIAIAVIIELVRGRTTREAGNTAPVEEMEQKRKPKGILAGCLSFAFIGGYFFTLLSAFAQSYNAIQKDFCGVGLFLFPLLAIGSAVVSLRQASRGGRVTPVVVLSVCALITSILFIWFLASSHYPPFDRI